MANTIRDELKDRFIAAGGSAADVPNDLTIRSMQKALFLQQGGEQSNLTNDSQTIQGMVKATNEIGQDSNTTPDEPVTPEENPGE